jgi:hypothetical protein
MPTYTEVQLDLIARLLFTTPGTIVPYLVGMWLDAAMMGVVLYMVCRWARMGWHVESRSTKILVVCHLPKVNRLWLISDLSLPCQLRNQRIVSYLSSHHLVAEDIVLYMLNYINLP